MNKVISICGIERGDFAYYTAALLAKAGKAVLVIDNSFTSDIFGAVSEQCEDNAIALRQNVSYMQNVKYDREYDDIYDYVIIWHGMHIAQEILAQSDMVYVLPDYTPNCLLAINRMIEDKDVITTVCLRDAVESTKISDITAMKIMDVNKDKLRFVIGYDNKDYENYLAFLYNGRQTFSNLTPNYSTCLKALVSDILEIDPKQANKLYHKTKKAKTFI